MSMRLILITLVCLFVPLCSWAQFSNINDLTNLDTTASLTTAPRFPGPNEQVTVTLNDYQYQTTGATIDWYINDVLQPNLQNQRSITITTGELGDSTTVRSRSTLKNGQVIPASTTIRPAVVDLLVEANTLTPSFYPGRALPSPGSQVRVTAIPFTATNGSNPERFSYTWEVNGEVQDGGAVREKNYVVFRSDFGRSVQVSVSVFDNNNTLITKARTNVPITDPELHFYEVNPLRGLLPTALRDPHIMTGNELRLRAEPYYYDPTALQNNNTLIEWEINGSQVENTSDDPFEVTLRRQGETGSFTLGYHIRNLSQLLQGVEDNIRIQF